MSDKQQKNSPPPTGPGPGAPPAMGRKPKNMKKTLGRIFGYLSNSRGLIILVVIAILFSSGCSIAGSYFLKPLINEYILPGDFAGLKQALYVLTCIYLAGVVFTYIQTKSTVRLAQATIQTIRKEMFEKMQSLPLKYYDTYTHGELMSRYTNDSDNIRTMLEQTLPQLISSCIMFIGVITLMIILSPILFCVTVLTIGMMILSTTNMRKKSQKHFKSQQKIIGQLNGNVEETIEGLKEIKAFNHEDQAKEKFNQLNEAFQYAAQSANFYAGATMPIMVNLNNISYAFTAVLGGILTAFNLFDLGSLASYLLFSRQIGQPINQVSSQLNNIYAAVAGAERIFQMMDEQAEVDEGRVVLKPDADVDGEKSWSWILEDGTKVPLKGDVRFHNVFFSYDPKKPVLKDISLYAKPGQMIAFVGSTGAGKTTITNLINRFYDIQQGTITYDGIDVKRIKKDSLRQSLGMVLQDTHLFTGTVMDNIRYGRLDATDEECIEAAKKANAHSFIKRLSKGYHTLLEGDGGNLSQGQRQLIAIARTYISNPPVMILDEATSSIDTRTERLVQNGMNELMKNRTVFVIAHRLSTVRNAKAIIVLEHGEIIERGDHEELLREKGRYYQLYHGLVELT